MMSNNCDINTYTVHHQTDMATMSSLIRTMWTVEPTQRKGWVFSDHNAKII